jgi:hypothetical protein
MGKTRWNDPLITSQDGRHRLVQDRWQWILQTRYSAKGETKWRPWAFCATKEGLMIRAREALSLLDSRVWSYIEDLPDYRKDQPPCSKSS